MAVAVASARTPRGLCVDADLTQGPDAAAREAADFERAGYDGIWVGETQHDPFLALLRAADATQRVTLGTGVAIAFARNPMSLAMTAYDLNRASRGRFLLGIGSQIQPHIERRFSMPWSQPAARMREFVLALRAIFDAFEGVEKLDFRGDFYKHTLLTPFFTPTRSAFGPPPILLAAVGERMTEVAGEVCDGLVFHPLSTERYFREVTESALARGAARSGRRLDAFERTGLAFVTVGRNDEEMARAREGTKSQIAFYASTPAYRGVLALHGREALQPELTKLTKAGRWKDLGPLIDDEFLGLVSVIGTPEDVGRGVAARYGPLATRIQLYAPYRSDPAIWPIVVDAIRREA